MATKKSAAATKKTARKKAPVAAKTTTKVTTVSSAASANRSRSSGSSFSFTRSPLLAASIAEFVGTFLLAAVVLAASGSAIVVLFALTAVALAVGTVSGSYLNPALTIAGWVTRRMGSARAVSYLVAQVLGALLALVVMNAYVTSAPEVSTQAQMLGQSSPALFKLSDIPAGKEWLVLVTELVGTAIFGFGVAAASRAKDRFAVAFGIGGSLFLGLAIAGYMVSLVSSNGAVLNPAVAWSLQGLSWHVWPLAVYVLAPVVGAVIGFAVRDLIADESSEKQ